MGGYNELPHLSFMVPFGIFSPPIMIAPLVQRYAHEFGAQPEHFGEVALVCRDNAHRNPRAVMAGRPLSMQDYLTSRIIAEPLRLYDCCQENDGACALIVTTLERARLTPKTGTDSDRGSRRFSWLGRWRVGLTQYAN